MAALGERGHMIDFGFRDLTKIEFGQRWREPLSGRFCKKLNSQIRSFKIKHMWQKAKLIQVKGDKNDTGETKEGTCKDCLLESGSRKIRQQSSSTAPKYASQPLFSQI